MSNFSSSLPFTCYNYSLTGHLLYYAPYSLCQLVAFFFLATDEELAARDLALEVVEERLELAR